MSNKVLSRFKERFESRLSEEMSVTDFLELCSTDRMAYATTAERMLAAIGEKKVIDTRKDDRLSRIFSNRKIDVYPNLSEDFYGMEDTIDEIVSHYRHAAQGLEEAKQVLYLLGPVGGGKSSLAEALKRIFQKIPFYTLKCKLETLPNGDPHPDAGKISPCYESPLGLFDKHEDGKVLFEEFKIPTRYLGMIASPWATQILEENDGDIDKCFSVVRMWPSILKQVGITKVEPGDENTQDIAALVGKVNIRLLDDYDQDDPRAYGWAGGMNVTTQGLMEFVEMFKAPIKMLHPMLTATQEGHYNGTEQFGAIPYAGCILAHSNEAEWETFRSNRNNEAFLDRVNIVKVPYCLRATEEELIYGKLIENSELSGAPCAPGTLRMMAEFSILTRMKEHEDSSLFSKMEVYDGKNLKDKDPTAKSLTEYRESAKNEGMTGASTRFAYKILSRVFNYDTEEVAANPVHLMYVLEKQIEKEGFGEEQEEQWIAYIKGILAPKFADFIGDEIQKSYLESYGEYGQNLFDRYIQYADFWIQDKDYRDPDTGENFDREALNAELEKIEKPASIVNPKDFRNEVVNYVIRQQAQNGGKNPEWTSYEKLREVIEKKMFSNTEEILPVISFTRKANQDGQDKHDAFVERMMNKGYTKRQVRLMVDWFLRYRKHN